jgi:hypothetical protein
MLSSVVGPYPEDLTLRLETLLLRSFTMASFSAYGEVGSRRSCEICPDECAPPRTFCIPSVSTQVFFLLGVPLKMKQIAVITPRLHSSPVKSPARGGGHASPWGCPDRTIARPRGLAVLHSAALPL